MANCRYCKEQHSIHWRCEAQRRAEAKAEMRAHSQRVREVLGSGAVNRPAVNRAAVNNGAVNRRGAYPGTDARREYMRSYMARRRSGSPDMCTETDRTGS